MHPADSPSSIPDPGQAGATLTELVTVLVLLGILAAFALPRFFGTSDFDARGYFELSIQAVRFAQRTAIASGCDTRVRFDGTSVALHQWINPGSCAADGSGSGLTAVKRPGSSAAFAENAPDDVAVGSMLIYFDAIGRPRDANPGAGFGSLLAAQSNVGVGGRTITVEPQTGFVRCTAGC